MGISAIFKSASNLSLFCAFPIAIKHFWIKMLLTNKNRISISAFKKIYFGYLKTMIKV